MWTFLSKDASVIKFSCVKFFRRYEPKCGKALSCDIEESFPEKSYPDPEADEFQN